MKIVLFGGTGFIGTSIQQFFIKKGYEIIIVTRKPRESSHNQLTYLCWDNMLKEEALLEKTDVWINLAGESINSGRWTKKQKEKIINSRISTTNKIITLLSSLQYPPSLFINGSAIGYYGTSLEHIFTEEDTHGNDFLANTVTTWEEAANKANLLHIRTCYLRFGIVLGEDGGALPRMVLPYRFFVGGKVGHGNQWLSWIHIDDINHLIEHIIHTKSLEGPINAVAPNAITMNEFGKTIANVMHRPHWLPVPSFVLRLLLGEMSTLVLDGQRVLPAKAIESSFTFKYPSLKEALQAILN
ncbi:MAG: TIGR01777 family oxidoreductase [Bacillaceae bacterium]